MSNKKRRVDRPGKLRHRSSVWVWKVVVARDEPEIGCVPDSTGLSQLFSGFSLYVCKYARLFIHEFA